MGEHMSSIQGPDDHSINPKQSSPQEQTGELQGRRYSLGYGSSELSLIFRQSLSTISEESGFESLEGRVSSLFSPTAMRLSQTAFRVISPTDSGRSSSRRSEIEMKRTPLPLTPNERIETPTIKRGSSIRKFAKKSMKAVAKRMKRESPGPELRAFPSYLKSVLSAYEKSPDRLEGVLIEDIKMEHLQGPIVTGVDPKGRSFMALAYETSDGRRDIDVLYPDQHNMWVSRNQIDGEIVAITSPLVEKRAAHARTFGVEQAAERLDHYGNERRLELRLEALASGKDVPILSGNQEELEGRNLDRRTIYEFQSVKHPSYDPDAPTVHLYDPTGDTE